ncbi:hypothetical protein F2Q69_00027779 [Brassica cretica]|uniref:SWIM-type domain-containing protein n=1 Tax=Brassica cretica TaxID=69181 RepID=A0A8S9S6W2_BRACR|nr:hypothetical protein F2Q69_00027779 [Brassica cretica]
MDRQLHAVYGESLLKDDCWNFVVDKFKGVRMFFLSEGSTHPELAAMAQEDYNLDMNTESVELAYSLPEAMMQHMAPDTPPVHVTSDRQVQNLLEITKTHEMDRQLHAVYGESLLKDDCWNFVVDKFKGVRMFFLSEGSTHPELAAMAQEDYNLDMNTESVELAYSLPEAMMQHMAPDTPPVHVTSDRQVQNLLEITKTHEVRLCVSSLSKIRMVSKEGEEDDAGDEADEGDEDDDDMAEDENHNGEDADIHDVSDAVDDAEDYNEYGKVKDEDEEEDEDMYFEDLKGTYELRLTAVRRRFSFRIYKSTKTLLVATFHVNGCGWKIRASRKHGTNTFWVTKYVETHTCSVADRIAQRKHCTPKYISRLLIDRVGIIDGLNPQHIKDAMKNMFGKTLDYTTSYRAFRGVEYLFVVRSEIADTISVQQIDGWRFFVKGGKMDCVVDLELRKCDCGVYAVKKIPCSHAIAAGSYAGLHISTLVCPVY